MTEEITFRDKITALSVAFYKDRYNNNRSKEFWYVMDSINDDLVLKWADRASKIKNPIGEPWDTKEWMQLCHILSYMKCSLQMFFSQ